MEPPKPTYFFFVVVVVVVLTCRTEVRTDPHLGLVKAESLLVLTQQPLAREGLML